MSISLKSHDVSRSLRAVLAVLLLSFAINTIAHASHTHDAEQASVADHIACAQCLFFGVLADTPHHAPFHVRVDLPGTQIVENHAPILAAQPVLAAAPRGPPVS